VVEAAKYDADSTAHPTILSLDFAGKTIDRWEVDGLRDIATSDGRIWGSAFGKISARFAPFHRGSVETNPRAMTDRLVELVGGGRVEERGPLEGDATIAAFGADKTRSVRVDCFTSDDGECCAHDAYCVAVGEARWRKIGSWDRLPFPCGPYLIEIFDLVARAGMRLRPSEKPQITVRRLEDGTVAAQRPLTPPGRLIVCGAPGELLVALNDVEGWSLPELRPLWKRRSPRGPVTALARVADEVLLATASGAFVTLRQPQAPPPPNAATGQRSQDRRADGAK
jgi:hypothetical protein